MYKPKDYTCLLKMPGFCEPSLELHFELYRGYVKNTNLLLQQLAETGKKELCFSELKRRVGWEFSGMRLHEYYFENLGGQGKVPRHPEFMQWIECCFGSFDAWKQDFVATGMMRGIGWAILFRDNQTGRLMNIWIEQHSQGHPAGCQPLLVMDVWEHAYMCDHGTNRKPYIEAFFQNLNWDRVIKRFLYASI